jgi:hypothetical protein
MTPRRKFRGLMMLWALFQFAGPTAATYADALLERSGVNGPTAHVESNTSDACHSVHGTECALCHLVHRVGATAAAACVPEIALHVGAPRETLALMPADTGRGRLSLPRAPPVM